MVPPMVNPNRVNIHFGDGNNGSPRPNLKVLPPPAQGTRIGCLTALAFIGAVLGAFQVGSNQQLSREVQLRLDDRAACAGRADGDVTAFDRAKLSGDERGMAHAAGSLAARAKECDLAFRLDSELNDAIERVEKEDADAAANP